MKIAFRNHIDGRTRGRSVGRNAQRSETRYSPCRTPVFFTDPPPHQGMRPLRSNEEDQNADDRAHARSRGISPHAGQVDRPRQERDLSQLRQTLNQLHQRKANLERVRSYVLKWDVQSYMRDAPIYVGCSDVNESRDDMLDRFESSRVEMQDQENIVLIGDDGKYEFFKKQKQTGRRSGCPTCEVPRDKPSPMLAFMEAFSDPTSSS